ncbi:MAG: TetR/AcrR family transcriptional regulator [Actinomycetota bacterium]
MSPRTADPAVREALVETAARLVAEREPLTTRRLAAEVGTSTMSVYTHFGSMDELRRVIRRDGFERLAEFLARVPKTNDPVADLTELGWAYFLNALQNPNLYRAMFMEGPVDASDIEVGLDTFQTLVDSVQRCIDAKRFTIEDDAWNLATQMWASIHGVVALHLASMLTVDGVTALLLACARNSCVAFGDDPQAIDRSIKKALRRIRKDDSIPPTLLP